MLQNQDTIDTIFFVLAFEQVASSELYRDGHTSLSLLLMASMVALSSRYRSIKQVIKEAHIYRYKGNKSYRYFSLKFTCVKDNLVGKLKCTEVVPLFLLHELPVV